jgi:signal transduction histidine kinase
MFLMRQKLKARNNDLQVAQIMERRAEHSKKQFVSYIFHEVRVPLNTAMLAVQNLKGEGVFRRLDQEEGIMMHGLTSSLGMMEKVSSRGCCR